MKNLSKQKLIKSIFKILKVSNEKKLFKLYRKNYDKWDSLAHLQIMFLLEKFLKKKFSITKINKISSGKNLIKIINENIR
tara:strand:- start:392 stop:631 length:240 start_codon:yes stop_codon:yes gene_type:complete